MNTVYEEVMAAIKTLATIRYSNWDIGQLSGYYLKPNVSFPCALISFPQIGLDGMGSGSQMGDVVMQLKIATASVSNTSSLTPSVVRAKGNEIWLIEKQLCKLLHGASGMSFNSMQRIRIQNEEREDGIQVLNVFYTFTTQDHTAKIVSHFITPMAAQVNASFHFGTGPWVPPTTVTKKIASYATFNSDDFLDTFTKAGYSYGYRVASCGFNGEDLGSGFDQMYSTLHREPIPTQVPPRDTVPAYFNGDEFFNYDRNFFDWLNTLPISNFLTFWPSPMTKMSNGHIDTGYPMQMAEGSISDPFSISTLYGEGMDIEADELANFSLEIDYLYSDGTSIVTGHTIEFTETGMYIDGAFVPNANFKLFTI